MLQSVELVRSGHTLIARSLSVFALAVVSQVTLAQDAPPPKYAVRSIAPLANGSLMTAAGVNTNAQVAGSAKMSGGITHAFVTASDAGAAVDLGTLGGSTSFSSGINTAGQVVGASLVQPRGIATHAFVTARGAVCPGTTCLTDLGSLGGPLSAAAAINDAGTVVGTSTTGKLAAHAFAIVSPYTVNSMKDLGTLGGPISAATAISSSGQIVGNSLPRSGLALHATSIIAPYAAGSMNDLGTLGGVFSSAYGVNASGTVVGGSSLKGERAIHAFVVQTDPASGSVASGNKMIDLGTLGGTFSQATAVNKAGVIVGTSFLAGNSASHGFIFQNGKMADLNSMLDASAPKGFVVTSATAVSDYLAIAVDGTLNGKPVAALLKVSGTILQILTGVVPSPAGDYLAGWSGQYAGTYTLIPGSISQTGCSFSNSAPPAGLSLFLSLSGTNTLNAKQISASSCNEKGQCSNSTSSANFSLDIGGGDSIAAFCTNPPSSFVVK